jgi:microcystin-dependent protein
VGNIPQDAGKLSPNLLNQKNILEDLGKYYLKLRDYKSDLEFVLANFDVLPDFQEKNDQDKAAEDRQKFKKSLEETCTEIDEVVRQATNCADDCSVCATYTPKVQFITLPGSRFESLDLVEGSPTRSRSAVLIGSILPYGGDLTNSELVKELDSRGWLPCDGKSYKISDYPELHKAIGLAFGGNSETFNVPDLRGRFMRGVAGESDQDPDRNSRVASAQGGNAGNKVGSVQSDEFKSHTHDYKLRGSTNISTPYDYEGAGGGEIQKTTTGKGGNETRPKNIYVYYIIKSK